MTDLRKIDVNLIVVLDAILNEMNLTRAGDAIGMSQPAVSGALARLRTQFDDPLLVRNGKIFEPTERALELRPVVAQAMVEIKRIFDILPTFDPATSTRTFYVAASDYALAQLTSPLIRLMKEEAPGTSVSFETMPSQGEVSAIDLLRRDVIVAGTGVGIAGKHQSLFSDNFVCIVDKNNPRLKNGKLEISDLAELRKVKVSFGDSVQVPTDIAMDELGIVPKAGIMVDGFLPVPFAVSNTEMYGVIPERIANEYAERLNLAIAETPLKISVLIESVHWHPSKSGDPALKWLVSMLRKAAEEIEFGKAE
jgi:DNA-binding transcriptional LysR family regulator